MKMAYTRAVHVHRKKRHLRDKAEVQLAAVKVYILPCLLSPKSKPPVNPRGTDLLWGSH